jgi:hypothetical protein
MACCVFCASLYQVFGQPSPAIAQPYNAVATIHESPLTQQPHFLWGITPQLGIALQNANFQQMPAIIYDTRTAFRPRQSELDVLWSVGAEGSWLLPLKLASDILLRLTLRADYEAVSLLVQAQDQFIAAIPIAPGSPLRERHVVTQQRSIDADFRTIGITPMLEASVSSQFHLGVGLRFGLMLPPTIEIRNDIVAVQGGAPVSLVASGSASRIDTSFTGYSGIATLQPSIQARVRYHIPLDFPTRLGAPSSQTPLAVAAQQTQSKLILVPELSFTYPLAQLVQGVQWQASSLRAGIGIMLHTASSEPPLRVPNTLSQAHDERTSKAVQKQDSTLSGTRLADTTFTSSSSTNSGTIAQANAVDTLYVRDTTLSIVSWKEQARIRLTERSVDGAPANPPQKQRITSITIREHYIRFVPRPTPALAGTLHITFTDELKSTEEKKLSTSSELRIHGAFDVMTFALREFRSVPDAPMFDKRDTIQAIIPPPLRLVPSVVAEAGVQSSWIDISIANRIIAAFPCDAITRVERGSNINAVKATKKNSVEWDAERDATLFPERCVRLADIQSQTSSAISFTLHAIDNERQQAALDTATLLFEEISPSELAIQRQSPTRVVVVATLSVPELMDSSVYTPAQQHFVDSCNRRILTLFKQEWNASKSLARKLTIVLPPQREPDTQYAQQIRLFVDAALGSMGIPASKVLYSSPVTPQHVPPRPLGSSHTSSTESPYSGVPIGTLTGVRIVLERKLSKQ